MKKERHLFTNGSRGNWGIKLEKDEEEMLIAPPNFLRDGALLRIADALELMTKDKAELQKEISGLQTYKNAVKAITDEKNNIQKRNDWFAHSNSSLRGVITRLKKQTKKGR